MIVALPYLFAGAVAVGAAAGGLAAWKWQEGEINRLELSNVRFQAAASIAEQTAKQNAARAQEQVNRLGSDLDAAQKRREMEYAELTKQIDLSASATHQCLSSATVRLLNDRPGHRQAPARKDPREILGLTTAPAADTGRLGGSSERAIVRWVAFARETDDQLREMATFLAGAVKAAPHCFEIVR